MRAYGSVPDVLPDTPALGISRRSSNWRRAGIAVVATLAVLSVAGVLTVRQAAPVALAEGCDEIECMINSPTKPPGAIKVPPRTLNPDEVAKLKEALMEEEQLESKVDFSRCQGSVLRATRNTAHKFFTQVTFRN